MKLLTYISLLSNVVYGFSSISTSPITIRTSSSNNIVSREIPSLLSLSTTRGGGGGGGGGKGKGKVNDSVGTKKTSTPHTTTELQQQQQQSTSSFNTGTKCPMTGIATILGSLWGTGGVLYILGKAIKRVLPIALEPFTKDGIPLSQYELGLYLFTCLWFAYVEGYKGFQTKFSPMVVKRSFTLVPGKNGTKWYHYVVAPLYSMGLLHATKKRQIVSWSVSIGVAAIVGAVKRLPYPYRNIIDAGVVTGLTWGSISILILYIKSWIVGKPPVGIDPELPNVGGSMIK